MPIIKLVNNMKNEHKIEGSIWNWVIIECTRNLEKCREAIKKYLDSMCPDKSMCIDIIDKQRSKVSMYKWVDALIKSGVPDGRARLILYVISRYLVNIKKMDINEAELVIEEFIDNSCRNYNDCSKIYKSWIRNVLRRVRDGGWMPWSLDRIKKEDPDLHNIINNIINRSNK